MQRASAVETFQIKLLFKKKKQTKKEKKKKKSTKNHQNSKQKLLWQLYMIKIKYYVKPGTENNLQQ